MDEMTTMLYTAGNALENASHALAYWEQHQGLTLYVHRQGPHGPYGGFAVVEEALGGAFDAARWTQTSPEELETFLAGEEPDHDEGLPIVPKDGQNNSTQREAWDTHEA